MLLKRIYSKQAIFYWIIIFLSALPLFIIFRTSELIHTHDGLVHLPRLAAFYKALLDGQFPVRWAGDLNYGYGMPLFNFIYSVPYYVGSLFLFLGFGLVNSFKLSLAFSFILSGIFMFLFTRELFSDNKKALIVTALYQFAPFHLVDLLARGSYGEVYTYAFLPLVLYGVVLSSNKFSSKAFLITAASSSLLILSHNSISLVFFVIAIGFTVFYAKSFKQLFFSFVGLLSGLLIASFYWIPAIYEHKYTYGDLFMKELFAEHWHPWYLYFVPNFLNEPKFQVGAVAVQFGSFHILAIISSIYFLFKKKFDLKVNKIIIFCLLIIVVSIFLMQPISSFLWERISFLRQFQFPWRFLSAVCFASSLLGISFAFSKTILKTKFFAAFIILIIASSIGFWQPQEGYDKIDEQYYWNFPLNTTYYGETDVIWSAGGAKSYPKSRIEVIGGIGKISDFEKKSNRQTFTVEAATKVQLLSNTQYFPGWRVFVDSKEVDDVQFQDASNRGLITFYVPKGRHEVLLSFGESAVRFASDIISIVSLIGVLIGAFYISKRYAKK